MSGNRKENPDELSLADIRMDHVPAVKTTPRLMHGEDDPEGKVHDAVFGKFKPREIAPGFIEEFHTSVKEVP